MHVFFSEQKIPEQMVKYSWICAFGECRHERNIFCYTKSAGRKLFSGFKIHHHPKIKTKVYTIQQSGKSRYQKYRKSVQSNNAHVFFICLSSSLAIIRPNNTQLSPSSQPFLCNNKNSSLTDGSQIYQEKNQNKNSSIIKN